MSEKNGEFVVRKAEERDLEKILDVQVAAYRIHLEWLSLEQIPPLNETIEGVRKDFENKLILVAAIRKKIVGSVRYGFKSGVCVLERLAVVPDYQKTGIGKRLVMEVEHQALLVNAHKIYLETGLQADELIRFYSRLGYSGEAVLKKHYGNFDWVVFSKFIDNTL